MDIGRRHDIADIQKVKATTKDPLMRKVVEKAEYRIKEEQSDKWKRSAREIMISERLQGRQENVRDIQDGILNRQKAGGVINSTGMGSGMPVKCDDCGVDLKTTTVRIKSKWTGTKMQTKCMDCWDKPKT